MRLTAALLLIACPFIYAQDETNRSIKGGGITAPGWTGKIDASGTRQGQTITDAKFVKEGDTFHVTTGPAVSYWNPADKASGNYTVTATFTEPKYMNLNDHPPPVRCFHRGQRSWHRRGELSLLRRLRERQLHCARFWTPPVSDERSCGRIEPRG